MTPAGKELLQGEKRSMGKNRLDEPDIRYSAGGQVLREDEGFSFGSYDLKNGTVYLLKERKPLVTYKIFEHALAIGLPGLCVTRQYPDRIKESFELPGTRFVWLSHSPGKDNHNPTSIGTLATLISSFIEKSNRSICLIDGLEYLVINNGFQQVLKFTELINEQVMQSSSMVLIPVSKSAFSEKEMALIERNIETIEQPSFGIATDKDLTDLIDKYR